MDARHRYGRAQSLVEFALILPLLVVLLLGLTDFGFLLYAHVQVANAAREGARAGSLFLGSRFQYTACTGSPVACPTGYGNPSSPDCWALTDWVQNGVVERSRKSDGCPVTPAAFSATGTTALGLLNRTRCATATTTNQECWWETITATTSGGLPTAGTEISVSVRYNHHMLFFGGLLGMFSEYTPITKIAVMKVQNN